MHLAPLIHDLAVILAVAGLVTFLFQRIKQPVVLGYIVAGIIVGPHTPSAIFVYDVPNIKVWAELGVIFLMFSLGLEFSFRKLARVGASAGATAAFEIVFMLALGFSCGQLFGWSFIDSIFLGAMLSISSTTIIIKALDELGLKRKKFAQLIFGVLIVEDLAAILILVALSTLAASNTIDVSTLAFSAGKLLLVVASWFIAGYFVVPRIFRHVGKTGSDEMLTTTALGFCLLLVVFAVEMNYSVALGAFIMGSILAESAESHRIEELVRPLKDLFAAIFFVSVGMLMDPSELWKHKWPVFAITLVTIFGKVFSSAFGALATGQPLRTSVQVGFGLGQIGEFSFIIATLGLTLGVISDFLYSIAVAVSIITTFTTPYLIRVSGTVGGALERALPDRINDFLARYVAWSEERKASTGGSPEQYKRLLKWLLNGLLVTSIWVLIAEYGKGYVSSYFSNPLIVHAVAWAIAILASAPFVWAMLSAATMERRDPLASGGRTFLMQVLTVVWIGTLSLAFFPARYVGFAVAAFAAIFFRGFYKRLDRSYQWFEKHFLSTFEDAEKSSREPTAALQRLAPWDAHLLHMRVNPHSQIAGKCIFDIQLRKRYGLNIVAIQRGLQSIVSPLPSEQIFPNDELLVLGTDEQVEAAKPLIEEPHDGAMKQSNIADYELKRLHIWENSPLLGRSIRDSRIREDYSAMVVGIERRGRRIMNPDTDMVFEIDDVILIVGPSDKVEEFSRKNSQALEAENK